MKHILNLLLPVLMFINLNCASLKNDKRYEFKHLDYTLIIQYKDVKPDFSEAQKEFAKRLDMLYAPDGIVSQINSKRVDVQLESDFAELLRALNAIAIETEFGYSPLMGKIYKLWTTQSGEAKVADYDLLKKAVAELAESSLDIMSDNRVTIIGNADLDLGIAGIGWAVDGAFEKLKSNGVSNAILYCNDVYRILHPIENLDEWHIDQLTPSEDFSLVYKVYPQPNDGLCKIDVNSLIYEEFSQKYHSIIDPISGFPQFEIQCVMLLAPNASTASAYAYATVNMGRSRSFAFIEPKPKHSLFMIYETELGITAETDSKLSDRLKVETANAIIE